MILSEQQLTQPGLQSLLPYWLGVKLNIYLCTFLLNKDLHRSALCAFVSLHTPCLFVCSNRKFLALEPAISQILGSSLSFEGKGGFAVVFTGTRFYPKCFFSQGDIGLTKGEGQGTSCMTASGVQEHSSFWPFLAECVKSLSFAIQGNSQLITSVLLSRAQILFLNSHLFETHLWFSSCSSQRRK